MGRGSNRIQLIASSGKEPEASVSQQQQLLDLIQEQVLTAHGVEGYDPVVAMALIGTDPNHAINPGLCLKAHSEVAKYTRPTLKQIEVSGRDGGAIETRSTLAADILGLVMQLKQKAEG